MITHRRAVKAAILLDKYCKERHRMCVSEKCVFGAAECPFEYGTPYYNRQDKEEMINKAELMDAMESDTNDICKKDKTQEST